VQCSLSGFQVDALLTRTLHQCRRVATARATNDQIPFECGRVDLQRSQQSRHVTAAAGLVSQLLQPACQSGLLECCLLLGGACRLEVDLVPNTFHLSTELSNPFGDLQPRRIQPELDAELR
jgi:hypothetical protein